MFVTNWISPTKIQKISEITNFFRHYFLSRTEVNIDIQNITRQELLENLKEGVLVTPNLDHLIKLQKDKEFYDVYRKEDDSCYVG